MKSEVTVHNKTDMIMQLVGWPRKFDLYSIENKTVLKDDFRSSGGYETWLIDYFVNTNEKKKFFIEKSGVAETKLLFLMGGEAVYIHAKAESMGKNYIGVMVGDDVRHISNVMDSHDYQWRYTDCRIGSRYCRISYKTTGSDHAQSEVVIDFNSSAENSLEIKQKEPSNNAVNERKKKLDQLDVKVREKFVELKTAADRRAGALDFFLDSTVREQISGNTYRLIKPQLALTQEILNDAGPYDLAIYADEVSLRGKLRFPGKNLFISARKVKVTHDCSILTGVDEEALNSAEFASATKLAWRDFQQDPVPATPGASEHMKLDNERTLDGKHGVNGADGIDASAGFAGGDVAILCDHIEYGEVIKGGEGRTKAVLHIDSSGGRGGVGQNGGKGGDGGRGGRAGNPWEKLVGHKGVFPWWRFYVNNINWPHYIGRGGLGGNGGRGGASGHGGDAGKVQIFTISDENDGDCLKIVSNGGDGGAASKGGDAGIGGAGHDIFEIYDSTNNNAWRMLRGSSGRNGAAGAAGQQAQNGKKQDAVRQTVTIGRFGLGERINQEPAGLVDQWRLSFENAKQRYLAGDLHGAIEILHWLDLMLEIDYATHPQADYLSNLRMKIAVRLNFVRLRLDYFGRTPDYAPAQSLKTLSDECRKLLTTLKAVEEAHSESKRLAKASAREQADLSVRQAQLNDAAAMLGQILDRAGAERERLQKIVNAKTALVQVKLDALLIAQDEMERAVKNNLNAQQLVSLISITGQVVMIATGNYAAAQLISKAGSFAATGVKALGKAYPPSADSAANWAFKYADPKLASLTKNYETLEKEEKSIKDLHKSEIEREAALLAKRESIRKLKADVAAMPPVPHRFGLDAKPDDGAVSAYAALVDRAPKPPLQTHPLYDRTSSANSLSRINRPIEAEAAQKLRTEIAALKPVPHKFGPEPKPISDEKLAAPIRKAAAQTPEAASQSGLIVGKEIMSGVMQIVPIVEEIGDLVETQRTIDSFQQSFGVDAIKFALDAGTFDKLRDRLKNFVPAGYLDNIKEKYDAFAKESQERNSKLLELQTQYLHDVQAFVNLKSAIYESKMVQSIANTAHASAIANIHAEWSAIYDVYRDRTLKAIHDLYAAYRYYALDGAGAGAAMIAAGDDASSDGMEIAKAFRNFAVAQNHAALSVVAQEVANAASTAHAKLFGARHETEIEFEYGPGSKILADLQTTGSARIPISPVAPQLEGKCRVYVETVRVLLTLPKPEENLPDAVADVPPLRVTVHINHPGKVEVVGSNGEIFSFQHQMLIQREDDAANAVYTYEAQIALDPDAKGKAAKSAFGRKRVMTKDEWSYFDVDVPHFDLSNEGYIAISPCTEWTISVPQNKNENLNLTDIQSIVLRFVARTSVARKPPSRIYAPEAEAPPPSVE